MLFVLIAKHGSLFSSRMHTSTNISSPPVCSSVPRDAEREYTQTYSDVRQSVRLAVHINDMQY